MNKKRIGESLDRDTTSFTEETSIPVSEERLEVGKEPIVTGKVRVSKKVHEEEGIVSMAVRQEEVEMERVPINQFIETAPPSVRYEGDTMIVSVVKEDIVVQKKLVLVEEIRITKKSGMGESKQPVTLRKEEVFVKRISPNEE